MRVRAGEPTLERSGLPVAVPMRDRLLKTAVIALQLGVQACDESSGATAHGGSHDKTAMTTTSAPERDTGIAEAHAMIDASAAPDGSAAEVFDASSVDTVDAATKQPRRPAASRKSTPAAIGGATGMHAATGGGGAAASQTALAAAGQSAGTAAPQVDPKIYAAGFSELFIDMPCDVATPTPLPEGMACSHAPNLQGITRALTFGGKMGTRYTLTLRVRAIWEPTDITGGEQPDPSIPFTVGGIVAQDPDGTPTNAINYQQFQIQVAEPAQTYWLNNYHGTAHEIHKEDFDASLEVEAGSEVKIIVNDGNDLEISNFRQLMFTDFPPYDKMPSLGQSLRFDVIKVEPRP
jgi:hypothetical protein